MIKSEILGLEFPELDDAISITQLNENNRKLETAIEYERPVLLQEINVSKSGSIGYIDYDISTYCEWYIGVEETVSDDLFSIYTASYSVVYYNGSTRNLKYVKLLLGGTDYVYSASGNFVYPGNVHYVNSSSSSTTFSKTYTIKLYGVRGPNYESLLV